MEKFHGKLMSQRFTMDAGQVLADTIVTNGQDNLFRENFVKTDDLLPQIILQVGRIESRANKIAGIKNQRQAPQNINNRFAIGNRFGTYMIKTASLAA
ncbi:MAG: hypothetical protein CVU51_17135 [Deltaproteobacteria bacterium HGW-Deltaproteobacteria-1]|nr:MAG: hypothetical protein CVU51_17135 [Deltaproteobacteria bacterium HGW-Deltaproteobacteria-1]